MANSGIQKKPEMPEIKHFRIFQPSSERGT